MVAGHLQEKKGLYYIVLNFTNENGKRKPKWIATGLPVKGNKRKAEALLRAEQQKYESGEVKSQLGAEMLFADYMLYWLKSIKGDVDVRTYSGYEGNVKKRIEPFFRRKRVTLAGIRTCDIQEFYLYCRESYNIGNNTIIHYHANISKALNDAVELDMISVNPIKKNLRPKKVEHNGNYYTLEETERLIRLVKGEGVEFPVLMAAFYGLRRSEIMGLRWQAIDFRENTITISRTVVQTRVDGKTAVVEKDRAKNKKSYRTLPLVPQYKELLLQMRAHQEDCRKMCGNCWQETGYVYVNDMGQPVKPNYVTQHFQLVLQKTGMRKITFHELRHTCASLLLKSGVPMKNIQEWLGHSSYSTTANIYAHLDAASKEETSTAMAGKLNISGNLLGMQSGTTLLPAEEQRKELGRK